MESATKLEKTLESLRTRTLRAFRTTELIRAVLNQAVLSWQGYVFNIVDGTAEEDNVKRKYPSQHCKVWVGLIKSGNRGQ